MNIDALLVAEERGCSFISRANNHILLMKILSIEK